MLLLLEMTSSVAAYVAYAALNYTLCVNNEYPVSRDGLQKVLRDFFFCVWWQSCLVCSQLLVMQSKCFNL